MNQEECRSVLSLIQTAANNGIHLPIREGMGLATAVAKLGAVASGRAQLEFTASQPEKVDSAPSDKADEPPQAEGTGGKRKRA